MGNRSHCQTTIQQRPVRPVVSGRRCAYAFSSDRPGSSSPHPIPIAACSKTKSPQCRAARQDGGVLDRGLKAMIRRFAYRNVTTRYSANHACDPTKKLMIRLSSSGLLMLSRRYGCFDPLDRIFGIVGLLAALTEDVIISFVVYWKQLA